MRRFSSQLSYGLFAVALVGVPPLACTQERSDSVESANGTLRQIEDREILGAIAYGETKIVNHPADTTYRAYSFDGFAGDTIEIGVSASPQDAMLWLVGTRGETIRAVNAFADDHEESAEYKVRTSGQYMIVFREANRQPARFRVRLAKKPFAAPAPTPAPVPVPTPTPVPPVASDAGTQQSTWTALPPGGPDSRHSHTTIWTGTEMIVWGGWDGARRVFQDGGRFNPRTNAWTLISTLDAPAPRHFHCAVWTGTEMIVWGGEFQDGGRYNPATNTWTAMSTTGAPSSRYYSSAVWTGTEMIVWGGQHGTALQDGGRYNPVTDAWAPIALDGAPSARYRHSAVWTGTEMIVWGGNYGNGLVEGGSRFNPVTNTWTPLPTEGAPADRWLHSALWTGSEMIVWGGSNTRTLRDGGRYKPATDSWIALPTADAPEARDEHTAVWTGTEMFVWGGGRTNIAFGSGGRFNPTTNSWAALTPLNTVGWSLGGRKAHGAVWTGAEMIVWGGANGISLVEGGARWRDGAP